MVRRIADPRNIQKSALIQASVCGMTANKFSRVPGSSVCMVDRLTHAWGPYQVNQSGRSKVRVAMTSKPYTMRNNAMGTGDWGAKKNAFHASTKDFSLTANPQASRHSRREYAVRLKTLVEAWNAFFFAPQSPVPI